MILLHINFAFNPGGAESMLADIVNRQAESHQVHLFILNNEVNEELLATVSPKVGIRLFGRKPGSHSPLIYLSLHQAIRNIHPDIIHCHHHKLRAMFPFIRSKTVLTLHSMNIPLHHLHRYDRLVAISGAVSQDVQQRGGFGATVILNGVDGKKIKPREKPERQPSPFRIVQVSSLRHEVKGQHILLRALHHLSEQMNIRNLEVEFIGTGESESILKKMAEDLNINSLVRFSGMKSRAAIYQLLCTCDLLVQPSLREGFGLTIIEAMIARIPVLVSNIDGPMEVIGEGRYGFFFEQGNPESCAAAIERIMQMIRNGTMEELTLKAADHASAIYDIGQTVKNYENLYLDLLKSQP